MAGLDMPQGVESPTLFVALAALAAGLLYVLLAEVRKIPARLFTLMATAFVDMVGLLMIIPLLPFYVKRLGEARSSLLGLHLGTGLLSGIVVSAFTVAQLLSAPLWGRFSDRYGRRPALLVAMSSAGVAYVIFAFANSIWLLLLSRIVQGAGGGTVGVIQAYVADSTEPHERARSLGWLSAATNLGVALGPVLGAMAVAIGSYDLLPGAGHLSLGGAAPGLVAALLCAANIFFAWRYLPESRTDAHHSGPAPRRPREAAWRIISHGREPASRLIWIYAIAMGAFQGVFPVLSLYLNARFSVTERSIGYFFMYIGAISVFTRILLLGKAVDWLGEARLSRAGTALLAAGLATMPLAPNLPLLALSVALLPLGTAFTFPCVTALLSRVISASERGLYMGLQQTFGGVARIVGPLWAGIAFDHLGMRVPFFTAAAVVLGTILLGLGLDRFAARQPPAAVPD
jgi:MFS family permease